MSSFPLSWAVPGGVSFIMKSKTAKAILQAIIEEKGKPWVMKTVENSPACVWQGEEREKAGGGKRRAKTQSPALETLRKMDVPDALRSRLEELARRYDDKSFLPTMGEVRDFCLTHDVRGPSPSSRARAVYWIFLFLTSLPAQELDRLVETHAFSGPTQLGPIAEAIRRSSEEGITSHPMRRGAFVSGSQAKEVKVESPSTAVDSVLEEERLP